MMQEIIITLQDRNALNEKKKFVITITGSL